MAREYDFQGLDNNTRRKTANRPFEDVRREKNEISIYHHPEGLKKTVEESVAAKPSQKVNFNEEPPTKARLTVREKKRKFVKTGVSLGDE
jgi:hypothetical protein